MNPAPVLGVTLNKDGSQLTGAHFALYSAAAFSINIAIYDPHTCRLKSMLPLKKENGDIWCVDTNDVSFGDYYVFLVTLNTERELGKFYNKRKALLDPYAKKVVSTDGRCGLPELVAEVVDNDFDWQGVTKPAVSWHDTIIYEAHVKGLTQLCEQVEPELRGRYLGVCHPLVINHLKSIGVTTLELMPCQAMLDELWLESKGLTNYWGYNPISFFSPSARYARKDSVNEFKSMVRELHRAGIEVVVDLVFNHTAEGNLDGIVLSMKGIDPDAYYLTDASVDELFINFTGCGNTLNAAHPRVVQLWMDALRYWYNELGVDGFRFDLGVTLGRQLDQFNPHHPFFVALQQDPCLKQSKLIFEPWDLGPNGYQLGQFPAMSAEWNGKFRDTMRAYVRGDGGSLQDFSTQFVASYDKHFHLKDRRKSSINFITAHDGFTLNDLVSYQEKHNELNGEKNRDGCHENFSRNYGVEGATDKIAVNQMRLKQKRNFLAVLALSKGVPMLLMGDELGRSQNGNNNAYCQDNEISWFDWQVDDSQDMRSFWNILLGTRARFSWVYESTTDIYWFRPDAELMNQQDWEKWYARSVACCFEKETGERLLLIFNMHDGEITYQLPCVEDHEDESLTIQAPYEFVFDTAKPENVWPTVNVGNHRYISAPHSIAAFSLAREN
ncbi:MAG: glycogen debranching protein GlgX [Pseudomonadales bacterium]|nr:glycogen debranching protein GlgX [Pseudomonadales bacterium]